MLMLQALRLYKRITLVALARAKASVAQVEVEWHFYPGEVSWRVRSGAPADAGLPRIAALSGQQTRLMKTW
jgi:hypothetical protein